jgi:hypothetical protein
MMYRDLRGQQESRPGFPYWTFGHGVSILRLLKNVDSTVPPRVGDGMRASCPIDAGQLDGSEVHVALSKRAYDVFICQQAGVNPRFTLST